MQFSGEIRDSQQPYFLIVILAYFLIWFWIGNKKIKKKVRFLIEFNWIS